MVTGQQVQPRALRFEKLADIHLELDRLEQADAAGLLASAGKWTPGQTLGHLAHWVDGAYSGFEIKTPLLIRLFVRMRKSKIIFGRMPRGVRIRGIPEGTLGTEALPFEEGMRRYRAALERLRVQPPVLPSPAFGDLSHSEWIALTCRHAELHLGNLITQQPVQNEARPASSEAGRPASSVGETPKTV